MRVKSERRRGTTILAMSLFSEGKAVKQLVCEQATGVMPFLSKEKSPRAES